MDDETYARLAAERKLASYAADLRVMVREKRKKLEELRARQTILTPAETKGKTDVTNK